MTTAGEGISWLDLPPRVDSAEALAAGKAARARVPRSAHATWEPAPGRPDPVGLLRATDDERLTDLVPVRFGRMAVNEFTFFRGAAAVMASDLSTLPISGIRTQICGDAHILNFGAYATPERNLVFDVNDFDETLPGAWEWDIKRLVASVAIAGRHLALRPRERRAAVLRCAATYRTRIAECARMRVLDVWYSRVDETTLIHLIRSAQERKQTEDSIAKALQRTNAHAYPNLVAQSGADMRIDDEPPLIFHPPDPGFHKSAERLFARYRAAMPLDRRLLLSRFSLVDAAYKVVGVGSVGTRCLALLLVAGDADPLVLQAKEALASVFEPYAGAPPKRSSHGDRVVTGQHLMQAASDLFLGAARSDEGRDFYIRQIRDVKSSANVERMTGADLAEHAGFCGWALARAHAKAGGVAGPIAGYLGRGDAFDTALATFAEAYADQNSRDYARLMEAIAAGEVDASPPAEPRAAR